MANQDTTPARPRAITLRFLAEPTDVNFGGKVHGGADMKWIDQAGYACAVGWSGYYCVTVYIGGISFLSSTRSAWPHYARNRKPNCSRWIRCLPASKSVVFLRLLSKLQSLCSIPYGAPVGLRE